MKRNWSVTVLYEDTSTRETAVQFCDALVKRFWAESEFSIDWRKFSELEDEVAGQQAETRGAGADLIIFASQPNTDLPETMLHWLESWVKRRGEREGAMIGLNDPGAASKAIPDKFCYLRSVAHRAGMDYLTHMPQELAATADSPESFSERARQVTHVLDEILHRPTAPKSILL
jgi:hypothetical protein